MALNNVRFYIDQPSAGLLSSHVVRVSGWFLSPSGQPADRIDILLDDRPVATTTRTHRIDVAKKYPDVPLAAVSGFVGDVALDPARPVTNLSCLAVCGAQLFSATARELALPPAYRVSKPVPRSRNYDLKALFSASAHKSIAGTSDSIMFEVIEGTPHFYDNGSLPLLRLLEAGETHGYPQKTIELIKKLLPDQIFLDLGCGIRPSSNIFENGIYLDAVHFPRTDVVSSCGALPFRACSIDLVVSHAVFEHLPDPRGMALEIRRVLKPGGTAYIDTAFMQPFHGDPNHYFNMTLSGLKAVFTGFEFLDAGISEWQTPSYGLIMQVDAIAAFIGDPEWRQRLFVLRDQLISNGSVLDESLGQVGREIIAAGVSVYVRRPLID